MTIDFEGNLDDRLNSFLYVAQKLLPLSKMNVGDEACVDLTRVHWLGPDGVSLIAGAILDARQRGGVVQVVLPSRPPDLVAFLGFSGFDQIACGNAPPDATSLENATVPLRQFRRALHQDPQPLVDVIAKFEPVSEELKLSLEVRITELVQNVEDHAKSQVGAVGCARFIQSTGQVRVALVDFGQGIMTSLQGRYPEVTTAVQALQLIAHGGYSAKSRRNNLGRGFDNLRSIVTEAFEGSLYVVSEAASAEFKSGSVATYHPLDFTFWGPAVYFTLPTKAKSAGT
jgi:hypothetical protein